MRYLQADRTNREVSCVGKQAAPVAPEAVHARRMPKPSCRRRPS